MEPITHLLAGACIGRAGFQRKTAYATLAAALAAEAADLDMVWGLRGAIAGFEHHRGITHSLVGAPFVALFVVGVVWVFDRCRKKRPPLAIRWFTLWLAALVAALSHIFLDSTNSYGVRPFYPFSGRWYSLNINPLWEPILFFALLLGLVLPAIFGLADREIGIRQTGFRGRGWAVAALAIAAAILTLRFVEHRHALRLLAQNPGPETPLRVAAEPYALNPFHWFAIAEFPDHFETGSIHTWPRPGSVELNPQNLVYKGPVTPAVRAAKESPLGRFYLNWARFPVIRDLGPADTAEPQTQPAASEDTFGKGPPNPHDTVVSFEDLRYAYFSLGHFRGGGSSPIFGATVYVSPPGRVTGMELNSEPW